MVKQNNTWFSVVAGGCQVSSFCSQIYTADMKPLLAIITRLLSSAAHLHTICGQTSPQLFPFAMSVLHRSSSSFPLRCSSSSAALHSSSHGCPLSFLLVAALSRTSSSAALRHSFSSGAFNSSLATLRCSRSFVLIPATAWEIS